VREATGLSGHVVDVVHLVGSRVRHEVLCQLTADACGLPVIAGPATDACRADDSGAFGPYVPGDLAVLRSFLPILQRTSA
jgi:rhamnulokinase